LGAEIFSGDACGDKLVDKIGKSWTSRGRLPDRVPLLRRRRGRGTVDFSPGLPVHVRPKRCFGSV